MRLNHLEAISRYWNTVSAEYSASHPEHLDPSLHPSWGMWNIPERELRILGDNLRPGSLLVEFGCGQGHDAVGFASFGLDVIAIDISSEQLGRAIYHPGVKYIKSAAERVPLADNSTDIVTSDHGAFDHSPPQLLLSEAFRILRPGGRLAFCTFTPLAFTCFEKDSGTICDRLLNDYPSREVLFDGSITSSQLSYSHWIRAIRASGLEVIELLELLAPPGTQSFFDDLVTSKWGTRWPLDLVWIAQKPLK